MCVCCLPAAVLVVVIACLARRGIRSLTHTDADGDMVKETMGSTDLEGFGEKDETHFDLNFLQAIPDGHVVGGEWRRRDDAGSCLVEDGNLCFYCCLWKSAVYWCW